MAKKTQKDEDALDIDRPEVFLKRERLAQLIGTGVLSVFVIAGVAGAFGNGPLSTTRVQDGNVTLTFERFTRQTFRTELEISIQGLTGEAQEIRIPRDFLRNVEMLETRPAESLKRLEDDSAVFEVPVANGNASLELLYVPKSFGVLHANIAAGSAPGARIRQIVYF
jgi:hypothetical protein